MKILLTAKSFWVVMILACGSIQDLACADTQTVSNDIQTADGGKDLKVYWVGHSLMESVADTSFGRVSVLDLVGVFANASGRDYAIGDHTLWGTPLSAHWRGKAHSQSRNVPERVVLRQEFERTAGRYDALVLTDTVPIGAAIKYEYSSYYLRKFYCAFTDNNPDGDVYLYESWTGLQTSKGSNTTILSQQQWRRNVLADRAKWDTLAENARDGNVTDPALWRRAISMLGFGTVDSCGSGSAITVLPIATALLTLHDWLGSDEAASAVKTDGLRLEFIDLIRNPYLEWPESNESIAAGGLATNDINDSQSGRTLKHADQEWDDVHPSGIGVYFNSLVTYSMLYKTSPAGLPALEHLGESLSRALQDIAWNVVQAEQKKDDQ